MVFPNNVKLYGISAFSALAGCLVGYHTGVISGILTMQDFIKTFGDGKEQTISSTITGGIVGILLLGCIIGSIIGGPASDKLSRIYSIALFSFIFAISAALQTASKYLSMLLVARFIAGISIGALSMIVPMYLAEIAITEIRGRLVTLQQFGITIGISTSFWVNYITHTSSLEGKESEWRIPLGIQIVPSLILGIGILFCPFSPRWEFSNKSKEEAKKHLMELRSATEDQIKEEFDDIEKELVDLRDRDIGSYLSLTRSPILHSFLLGIGIQVLQQLTGINSIIYYAPQILNHAGYNNQTSPLLATGIDGCVNVIATIPTIIFIDKLGRKIVLRIGAIIMAISFLIVAILMGIDEHHKAHLTIFSTDTFVVNHRAVSWAIIVFIYIFVAAFAFSWGPIAWLYNAEIYPITVRAKAISLTTAANWTVNCAVSFLVPVLLESISYGTFIIFSIFCAIATGLVCVFYDETKDRNLEDLDIHARRPIVKLTILRNLLTKYGSYRQQADTHQAKLLNEDSTNA